MHRFQSLWLRRILFDLRTNLNDEVIDRPIGTVVTIAPNIVDERIARIRPIRMFCKKNEQFACPRRELDRHFAAHCRHIVWIYRQIATYNRLRLVLFLATNPAHCRCNPSQKLAQSKRLRNIIVCPQIQPFDLIGFICPCR